MASRALFMLRAAGVILITTMAASVGLALTFDVNTTADGPDADLGDGVCATLVGPCTLRAAIEEANALGGAHTINLPHGTYNGGHFIAADVTLVGFRGGPLNTRPRVSDGVLYIASGAHVSITDVAVVFGTSNCIFNEGELELTRVGVYGCTATAGGGILNGGFLTMTDGEIEDSEAQDHGGLFDGLGGGLANSGTATLTRAAIRRNTAAVGGGGVANLGGDLTLVDCWLDDNTAALSGGGILSLQGPLSLTRVTLSRNQATDDPDSEGGGLWADTTATLTNVTFHTNTSVGPGGALSLTSGTFGLVSVTIVGNSSGLATVAGTTVQVVNTLIQEPAAGCVLGEPLASFGHNLDLGDSCGLDGPGDMVNTPVLWAAPGLYGGFGETIPLLAGSPGIDDGDTGLAPPTDQRGVPRFDGDGDGLVTADIGAYEYGVLFGDGFEFGSTDAWSDTSP